MGKAYEVLLLTIWVAQIGHTDVDMLIGVEMTTLSCLY